MSCGRHEDTYSVAKKVKTFSITIASWTDRETYSSPSAFLALSELHKFVGAPVLDRCYESCLFPPVIKVQILETNLWFDAIL